MNLFIVESPGKVEKIQGFLDSKWPNSFKVAASVGHVCDLPKNDVGFTAPNFSPRYEISPDKTRVVNDLKRLAKNAEMVFLATDLDREGEAIAYHLKRILNLSDDGYVRLKYNSITKDEILKSFDNGVELDMDMVAAQETRRFLDRMIGYYLYTPVSSALLGKFPVGRGQSSALKILGDHEKKMRDFKSHQHYNIEVAFNAGWSSKWDFSNWFTQDQKDEKVNQWLEKSSVDSLIKEVKGKDAIIEKVENKESLTNAPPPFITVTLQAVAASNKLGFDIKKTMQVAQKLYEGGHITYHRTDATVIAPEGMDNLRTFAETQGIEIVGNKAKVDANAQEAHECIRPTHFEVLNAGDDEDERNLYKLIWLRTVASQMAPATYNVKSVLSVVKDVVVVVDGQKVTNDAYFKASMRTLKTDGWLSLLKTYQIDSDSVDYDEGADEAPKDENIIIPADIAVGETHNIVNASVITTKTKAKGRFTMASLVSTLKRVGIGRPATYVSLCERLIDHGYIKIDNKKRILVTDHGMKLIEGIENKFSFVNPHYTKGIETVLDGIASGDLNYIEELNTFHGSLDKEKKDFVNNWLANIPMHNCKSCSDGRMLPQNGIGRDKKPQIYWRCNNSPACGTSCPNKVVNGQNEPGIPTQRVPTTFECSNCSRPLIQIIGDGFNSFTCSQTALENPDCHASYKSIEIDGVLEPNYELYKRNHTHHCPAEGCEGWLMEIKGVKQETGNAYHFFSCERTNKFYKGKKCKSGILDLNPDGTPNPEPRRQETKTEHPCICGKPLTHIKYRKEEGVYNIYYKCEVAKCKRNFDELPEGGPDTQMIESRTGKQAKCFSCGNDMIQRVVTFKGERSYRWDCYSCGQLAFDRAGEPSNPADAPKKSKAKAKTKKA